MKDLKHLLYFEDLLQTANNELIEQARADGRKVALRNVNEIIHEVLELTGFVKLFEFE